MSEHIQKPMTFQSADLERFLQREWTEPFSLLGMHRVSTDKGTVLVVRIFDPQAKKVAVVESGNDRSYLGRRIDEAGFFEVVVPGREAFFAYELEVEDTTGQIKRRRDPYSFWPILGEYDQYLTHVTQLARK